MFDWLHRWRTPAAQEAGASAGPFAGAAAPPPLPIDPHSAHGFDRHAPAPCDGGHGFGCEGAGGAHH